MRRCRLTILVVLLIACNGGLLLGRDLRRRVRFAQLYDETEPTQALVGGTPLLPVSTKDLQGVTFKTLDRPNNGPAALCLKRNKSWKAKSKAFERAFDRHRLTGLRFAVINEPERPHRLVLVVDQPGIAPFEGVVKRLEKEEQEQFLEETGTKYRYLLHLPIGSLADGEMLVLGAE